MKKILFLLIILFAGLGIGQAQDVYFAGNYNGSGKVWKNDSLLYSIFNGNDSIVVNSMKISAAGTLYIAGSTYDTTGQICLGRLWSGDSLVFSADTGSVFSRLLLIDSIWATAGLSNARAAVWRNGSLIYTQHDTIGSQVHALAMNGNDIYYAGSMANDSSTGISLATVWKNDTILWQQNITSTVLDIHHDGTDLYAVGFALIGGDSIATLWKNDSVMLTTDSLSSGSEFTAVDIFDNNIYLAGYANDTLIILKNGEKLYGHYCSRASSRINVLVVNDYGVYYAGLIDGVATVWKNGTILHQPSNCEAIVDLAVRPIHQPAITVFALPWSDGFETDSTYWNNWTILDFDGNHDISWQRIDTMALEGSFSARHLACDNIQEGWLITPPLKLRTYCDSTWMTFNTKEIRQNSYTYSGLWISTTDSNISSFTEIWSQTQASDTWDTVRINLSQYQGDTVLFAFKYSGHHGHDWYIDNVKVEEALMLYNITAEADSTGWGTVTGSGSYPYGDTAQIRAIPNTGREFLAWNDGSTINPRNIIVTQDSSFVAHFGTLQYTVNVVSDHPAWGSVNGGGTYNYGESIMISATPNLGFAFAGWTDGVLDNPRTIIVTESQTFTAHFEIRQCVINTDVHPANSGTVNGGGTYNYGSSVQLVAHGNTGYIFSHWSDGILSNPRSIFVEGDAFYTAVFVPLPYVISTSCDPVNGGTVTGAGTYNYGTAVTLTAIPNEHYIFICWNDGSVNNPRTITVQGNATYTAIFMLGDTPKYNITVVSNDESLGTVSGSGVYPAGSVAQIRAIPTAGAMFSRWNDNNTENPRNVVVNSDMTFTAYFTMSQTYTITVRPMSPNQGSTYGGGTFAANTNVTIGAIPASGYYFAGWNDGNMNNPRTIVVNGDAEYIASFSQQPSLTYTVNVYYEESQGFVIGAGSYAAGATATIAAIPADGYHFVKWSDNTIDNPKEIVVDRDIILAAFFNSTGIDDNEKARFQLYPNPAYNAIHIEGLEGHSELCFYNVMGVLVKQVQLEENGEVGISELPSGLYLIRINGQNTLRFMKN